MTSCRHLSTRLDASINAASATAAAAGAAIIAQVVGVDLGRPDATSCISSTEKRRKPMPINRMNARSVCRSRYANGLTAAATGTGS